MFEMFSTAVGAESIVMIGLRAPQSVLLLVLAHIARQSLRNTAPVALPIIASNLLQFLVLSIPKKFTKRLFLHSVVPMLTRLEQRSGI